MEPLDRECYQLSAARTSCLTFNWDKQHNKYKQILFIGGKETMSQDRDVGSN